MAGKPTLHKVKKIFIGGYRQMGLLPKAVLYIMLISLCFVYVYPLLHMGITSLKSMTDLLDPSVKWLPHEFTLSNYTQALEIMGFSSISWKICCSRRVISDHFL